MRVSRPLSSLGNTTTSSMLVVVIMMVLVVMVVHRHRHGSRIAVSVHDDYYT